MPVPPKPGLAGVAAHVHTAVQRQLAPVAARSPAPHVLAALQRPPVPAVQRCPAPAPAGRAAAAHVQTAVQKKPAALVRAPSQHLQLALQKTAPEASRASPARVAQPARSRLPAGPALPPRAVSAPSPARTTGAARVVQRTSLAVASSSIAPVPTHRYVNSREFACATTPLMTDSVTTCVAIILHNPTLKTGCLGHIDTDIFGETYGKRLPFLLQSIQAMVARVGSSASDLNLYALGGSGWFDSKAFHEAMDSTFAKVMVQCDMRLNNKKILYDPNGSPPVKIGDYAVTKAARTTDYEADVEGYEDRGLLFQVNFAGTESYATILDEDPDG